MQRFIAVFLLLGLLAACGSSEDSGQSQPASTPTKENTSQTRTTAGNSDAASPIMAKGKQIYTTYCLSCHQKNGQGVPNLNPTLVNTDWVLGDEERLIKVVLNGLNEEIEVNGEVYHNPMASFANLSDQNIAAVLTYIRNSWGNKADPISPETVASVRAANRQ